MCGSTAYYEAHGDAAGLRLVTDFFNISIPIVEGAGGWVRRVGDEILAQFVEAGTALQVSLEILSALARVNGSRPPMHQIHTRVTLHFGSGLVLTNDIYGDVVNVTAKIASLHSEPDTILVSQEFVDNTSDEVRARFTLYSTVVVEGKSNSLTLYKYSERQALESTPHEGLVRKRLVEIAGESSAKKADKLLRDLLSNVRNQDSELLKNEPLPAPVFVSQILSELARVAVSRETRAKYWSEAFQATRNGWEKSPHISLAEAMANVAVDCFQDEFNSMAEVERTYQLREARRTVDATLKMSLSAREKASLFARKSSLIRHLATTENTPRLRRQRLEEAGRVVSFALKQWQDPPLLLEAAAAQWALASTERTDFEYAERLRITERILTSTFLQSSEVGQLALAQFYRWTYRPLECCECFPKRSLNIRRLFRDSFLYAEAAAQLARSQYPTDIVQLHVSEAVSIVERAVAAGVVNARTLVDLAFLRVAADPGAPAAVALVELYAGDQKLSWSDVLEWIATIKEDDLVSGAFVLGIEHSGVLSRLASFCRTVLANPELGEALARVAVKIGPHNAVALTNLARGLVASNDRARIIEAEAIIEKVPNFADRRFRWWRAVRRDIKAKLHPNLPPRPSKELKPSDGNTVFTDFDQIIHRLDNITTLDPASRSLQFGYLVKGLVQLTAGTELVRDQLTETGEIEVKFLRKVLRLIPIWKEGEIKLSDLASHTERSGTMVAISMSQFATDVAAWQSADGNTIVLIERPDCENALREQANFDEVLSRMLAKHRVSFLISKDRGLSQ